MAATATAQPRVLGRYTLYDVIASGGMATVHFGRLLGPVGFARTVAIKRLHPQFAHDPEFVSMFLDEARLAARIGHPNVVSTLDVVAMEGELFLVMEYVQGESFGNLLRTMRHAGQRIRIPYAVAIVAGALRGLHAAHEATDERGGPLGIVHRDVSPQNIIVGIDGAPRVLDFGVAKAAGRLQNTREGQLKGKMAYMPPEQIRGNNTDRRTDVYATGAVLWEALTGRKLFRADSDVAMFGKVLEGKIEPPSTVVPDIPPVLDSIVMQALAAAPEARYQTAREMARALDRAVPLVAPAELGEWVEMTGAERLARRAQTVSRIENDSSASFLTPPQVPPPSRSQPALVEDLAAHVVPEAEISVASALHSAVVATSPRSRLLGAVVGGSVGLLLVGVCVAVIATRRGDDSAATGGSRSGVSASPVGPTVSVAPPDLPPARPQPAPLGSAMPVASVPPAASTSAAPSSTTPVAQPPPPASTPAAPPTPAVAAPPRPPARSHALDSVLDSRK